MVLSIVWATFFAASPMPALGEGGDRAHSTRETAVCKILGPFFPSTLTFSPDNRRVAFAVPKDKSAAMVLDGVEGKSYAFIPDGTIEFSPDSKRFAYVGGTGSDGFLVLDGVEPSARYPNIGRSSVVFSADSRHIVYGAMLGEGQFAVVRDGAPGSICENVDPMSFLFSADSQHFAYKAQTKGKRCVVVDEVAGPLYDRIEGFVFSPDSSHTCYIAWEGKKCFLVRDGVPDKVSYDEIEFSIYITPPQVAAKLKQALTSGYRLPGVPRSKGLLFSPDSKRFAFHAKRNGKWFCILDGVEGPAFDELEHWPCFSPDSKRYADTGVRRKKSIMIVDGVETEYEGVVPFTLSFSSDSRHVAFAATNGSDYFVVLDGVTQKGRYPKIGWAGASTVALSPDGSRIAVVAGRGNKMFVVVDGVEGKPYDQVKPGLWFSPDGKHLAYRAGRGEEEFVVVDGEEGKGYAIVWAEGPLFQESQTIRYLALQASDGTIFRVETDVGQ